jgi:phage terminase small subunit
MSFGMPFKRVFSERFAATQDRTYAAEKAGYAQPSRDAGRALARPEVQADISRRVMEKLAGLGELAVTTVHEAMTSSTATWTNKLTAADMVLKRLERGEGTGGKEASEMTASELEAAISALRIRQAEIADNAKDITPDPGVFD